MVRSGRLRVLLRLKAAFGQTTGRGLMGRVSVSMCIDPREARFAKSQQLARQSQPAKCLGARPSLPLFE